MRLLLPSLMVVAVLSSSAHASRHGLLVGLAQAKGKLPTSDQMKAHREKIVRKARPYSARMQHFIGLTAQVAARAEPMNVGRFGGRIGKAVGPEGGESGWTTSSDMNGA